MRGVVDPIRAALQGRLLAFLALLLASSLLPADALRADTGWAVRPTVCVAPQRSGDSPRVLLSTGAQFDCFRPASAWGPGNYWVRLTLPPGAVARHARSSDTPLLRFVPRWQRTMTIYSRDSGGTVIGRTLDNAAITPLIRIGGAIGLALDGHRHPVTDVLVRIDGAVNATDLMGGPQVITADRLHADELIATAIFAAFAGLGIGLFCYNIVLWLTIRERFQLTYCLSLLAMLAYVWVNSGAMALQFPHVPNDARLATNYAMIAFVAALSLQFITDFIEPRTIPRALRKVARNYGMVIVLAAMAVAYAPDQWRYLTGRAFVVSFVPLPLLVVAMAVLAWRRGSRAIQVLMVAWAVPILVTVFRIAYGLNLLPEGPLLRYSVIIGMAIEALLSSLAMSYRIKLVTAERDRAIADEAAARHLAGIDSLTGLLNRRALLGQVIEWSSPEPLRLLIIDIDHFKQINDTHGHLVGDEVLRAVAEILAIRAELRGSVARLGGEEFALVGTANELPEAIAHAILADIRSRPMVADVRITVSIGMAVGLVHSEDAWRDLYHRADAALYRAKAKGRNRAVSDLSAVAESGLRAVARSTG